MFKFEAPSPIERAPSPEKEISFRPNKVVEVLSKKFPKFKALALAFMTAAASLSTPEAAALDTESQHALSQEGAAVLSSFKSEFANIGSQSPDNAIFINTLNQEIVNGVENFSEDENGSLPRAAQNVVIGTELGGGIWSKNTTNPEVVQVTRRVLYIAPTETLPASEGVTHRSELEGVGATEPEAIQGALFEAIQELGVTVQHNQEAEVRSSSTGETEAEDRSSHILSGKQFIKEYKVLNSVQTINKEGKPEFHVTVEVVN